MIALLLAPSVWTEYTVAHASANMTPSAGPNGVGGFGGGRGFLRGGRAGGFPAPPGGEADFGFRGGQFGAGGGEFGRGGGFGFPDGEGFAFRGGGFRGGGFGGPDDSATNQNLIRYLEAHQGKTKFLVATLNAGQAEPFILATDKPVMDLGGFMGGDRIVNPKQLAHLVSNGSIRYFLLSGGERDRIGRLPSAISRYFEQHGDPRGGFPDGFRGGFGGPGGAGTNNDLVQWVSSHCSVVPASAYHTVSVTRSFGGGQQLYDCGAYATAHAGS
jgi:hypothetical protein